MGVKIYLRFQNALLLVALALNWPASFFPTQAADVDSAKLNELRAGLQPFIDNETISGAVALVGHGRHLAKVEALGWADLDQRQPMRPDTLFWIASMTKPITATAILMLEDEGKLSVDDPVEKHLPEFRGQWLLEARTNDSMSLKRAPRPVTIRDLLTHTSGLADFTSPRPDSSLAELVIGYSQQPLQFPPGSKWSYSNAGINTLGRIVEVVSGQPFADFLDRRLFQPLGMKDTTFWPNEAQVARLAKSYKPKANGRGLEPTDIYFIQGKLTDRSRAPRPAGGLFSTAQDYYRFCQMIRNDGSWEGQQLLSRRAVAAMTQTQTRELSTGFTEGMSFGFGFGVVKEPAGVTGMLSPGTFGHGGAYGTQAWVDRPRDLIMILMIQRANLPNADNSEVRRVLQEIAVSACRN